MFGLEYTSPTKNYYSNKGGDSPNADDVGLAGLRSKHNTYMSVPLIWTMSNQHHVMG